MTLLVHCIWAAVAVYAVREARRAAAWFAPHRGEPVGAVEPPVEVPEDLQAVAAQEQAGWAQEEVLRAIRERFEDLKDWNKVRAAFGVGRID